MGVDGRQLYSHRVDPSLLMALNGNRFSAEASTLRITPGRWPEIIEVGPFAHRQPLLFHIQNVDHNAKGDVTAVKYLAVGSGRERLTVYND